jgi:hypothetical protein
MKITLVIDGKTVFDLNADPSGIKEAVEEAVDKTLNVDKTIKGPIATFGLQVQEAVDKIYDGIFSGEDA